MDTSVENAVSSLDLLAATSTRANDLSAGSSCAPSEGLQAVLTTFTEAFSQPFSVVDVLSGDLVHSDYESLSCDLYDTMGLLAEVSRRGTIEIVEEVAPLVMLAIPLRELGVGENLVAIGIFVNASISEEREIAAAAQAFGVDARRALRWSNGRSVWSTDVLCRVASTVHENILLRQHRSRLEQEVLDAVAHTSDIYAELDLLHRLTGQLHLSESEHDLWKRALGWLADTVPAQRLSVVVRHDEGRNIADDDLTKWEVLSEGECATGHSDLCELIRRFGPLPLREPIVLNRAETSLPTWHCPEIRELVCVPIDGVKHPRGWLLALNHRGDSQSGFCEFGSVEIQLLKSVGTILGIHNSNLKLYREQSELFGSAVQALTSAIDAKDQYTAGHSDRVAQFSVAIAQQMGLDESECNTLYLAGLLHDIGKIGIDDQVLNKPGELTPQEFAQIKLHPQFGYEILKGVRQLDNVLPIVLHHHEAWNGTGYPHGLAGTAIPQMARIMAVADSFDAMSSNRPYREGMPDEKIDSVLRNGAGEQWDAEVVEAFFAIRDRIREIMNASPGTHSLSSVPSID